MRPVYPQILLFLLSYVIADAEPFDYQRNVIVGSPSGARSSTVVLVEFNGSDNLFTHAKPDGADIRFESASLPVPFQTVEYSPSENYALFMVRLDTSLTGQDTLLMKYGNTNAVSVSQSVLTPPYFVDDFNWTNSPTRYSSAFDATELVRDNERISTIAISNLTGTWNGLRENGNILLAPIGLTGSAAAADTFDWTWFSVNTAGSPTSYAYAAKRPRSLRATGGGWIPLDTVSTHKAEDPFVIHRAGRFEMYAEEKESHAIDCVGRWICPDSIEPAKFAFDKVVIPPQPHLNWADISPSSPALWNDTTNHVVYCYFEGKGSIPWSGPGCIGLAAWNELGPDTFIVFEEPLLKGAEGLPFEDLGVVPDDILHHGQDFYFYYHGQSSIRGGTALAISQDTIVGPYMRRNDLNPMDLAPTFMVYSSDNSTKHSALAYQYSNYLTTHHFQKTDTTVSISPWTFMRRGTESFSGAGPNRMAAPRCEAIDGRLLMNGDPFITSSASMVTDTSFVKGVAIDMRFRLLNDLGVAYLSMGFGSDSLCDDQGGTSGWNQTSARSSYSAHMVGYSSGRARLYRTPPSGNLAWLATTTLGDGTFDDYSRMTFAYSTLGRLIWQLDGDLVLTTTDVNYLNKNKRARISSGNHSSGGGGTIEAKWAMVRPYVYPEPAVSIMNEIIVAYNAVDSLVIFIEPDTGDDISLRWSNDSEAQYYYVFRSASLDSVMQFSLPTVMTTSNQHTFVDELLGSDERMYYSVAAVHAVPAGDIHEPDSQRSPESAIPMYSLPTEESRPDSDTPKKMHP